MSLILFLFIFAVIFGVSGFVTAAKWLLILAAAFWLLGVFSIYSRR